MTATLGALLAAAAARLAAAGVADPRLDARVLAAQALGLAGPAALGVHLADPVPPAAAARFEAMVARRAGREPVGRILGRRGFWTLDLALGPDTLEPRPDTETVVQAVLARPPACDPAAALSVLDLGTGTGCLLLALLAERPAATGTGLDIAAGAVATAEANAAAHGLGARATFAVADWRDGLAAWPGPYDVIVANPPYIPTEDLARLAPEVRGHDPAAALDGGTDGLDACRILVPLGAARLRPGGLLAMEIGVNQADATAALMTAAGLSAPAGVRDLGGHVRCLAAHRPAPKNPAAP